jgi:hypothetical protein
MGPASAAACLSLGHGILEAFADAIEGDPRITAGVGRHGRDGLLKLVELGAPFAQLSCHGVEARGGIDLRETRLEVALEPDCFVEIFVDGHRCG